MATYLHFRTGVWERSPMIVFALLAAVLALVAFTFISSLGLSNRRRS
jgi:type VI protein secretion system component VasF